METSDDVNAVHDERRPSKDVRVRAESVADATRRWIEHGWPSAAPGMAAITAVLRAQRVYQARMDAVLRPFDLNSSRYEVMMLLHFSKRRGLPLGIISDRLQVNPATVTNTITRLVRSGYVELRLNPFDGRSRLAALTPDGCRVAVRVTELANEQVFCALSLSRPELELFTSLLTRLAFVDADVAIPDLPSGPRLGSGLHLGSVARSTAFHIDPVASTED